MTRSYSSVAVSTKLSTSIDDTVSSFNIDDPSGWPTSNFTLRIGDEIMLVGTRTGNALSSITRGYSGTAKAAHSAGDDVVHVVVAEDYDGIWKIVGVDVDAYPSTGDDGKSYIYNESTGIFELQVAGSGGVVVPDWVSALAKRDDIAHADDDEFDDGVVDAAWTHLITSGSPTVTEKRGVLSILTGVQSSNDCNAFLKPIASGTNVVLEIAFRAFQTNSNYLMIGPVFSTGTTATDNVIWQMSYFSTSLPVLDIRSGTFTNVSTDHNSPGSSGPNYVPLSHWYQRFEYDSTNGFRQWFSPDGVSWSQLGGGWVSNPLGGAPTHMGIGYSTWGGEERIVSVEYFRVNPT